MPDPIPCPLCAAVDTNTLGPIVHPQPPQVAGIPIDLNGLKFHLRGCSHCAFQFKYPPIPEEKLLSCYEQATGDHWEDDPNPHQRRFDAIRKAIERYASPSPNHQPRSILDIGCFNGAFLKYLGPNWSHHGIEPSTQAADLAEQRGISILAPTLEELPKSTPPFDVIIALDVIEHLTHPGIFFSTATKFLKPGGILLVLTGDTASPAWKLHGSRHWYCSLPEHISFYSEATMLSLADQLNLKSLTHIRLSHVRTHLDQHIKQIIANLTSAFLYRTRGLGIPPLYRRIKNSPAPGWLTARDHMLHILQKLPHK